MKIVFTIRSAVLLIKVVGTERDRTLVAVEALGVPLLAHCIDRTTLVKIYAILKFN